MAMAIHPMACTADMVGILTMAKRRRACAQSNFPPVSISAGNDRKFIAKINSILLVSLLILTISRACAWQLQILSQCVNLIDQILNVLLVHSRVGNDIPEKVGQIPLWLIAHHQTSFSDHPLLDFRLEWAQLFVEFRRPRFLPVPLRHIPETSIDAFWLFNDDYERVGALAQQLHQVFVHGHQVVNVSAQTVCALQ